MTLISTGEKPTELSFISLSIKENLHLVFEQCDLVRPTLVCQLLREDTVIYPNSIYSMLDSETEVTL